MYSKSKVVVTKSIYNKGQEFWIEPLMINIGPTKAATQNC